MTGQSRSSWSAVAAHVISLAVGFLVLLACNQGQWFFGDEWDFLARRGLTGGEHSIWAPHTEHWSTGPILIYRALYSLYGVRTYVPYVVVLLVLHLTAAHLLWRLMRRTGVDPLIATVLSAVFVFLGAGHENLLWAFQIGFIGSVALGLAGLLLVNHGGGWDRRDFCAWVLSLVGLTFSGVSVTMVAVAGLTVLMRRGLRDGALTVVPPGIAYGLWFTLIGNESLASDRGTFDDVLTYPGYIWAGLRYAFELAAGFPGAGPLIVLGLAAFLLRRADHASGPAAPAFACALGTVVMFALIATARAGLGLEQAQASRYAYIVVALALPAIGLALSELSGWGWRGPVGRGSPSSGAVSAQLGLGAPANAPHAPAGTGGRRGVAGRRAVLCLLLLLVGLHNGALLRDRSREEKRLEQGIKAKILAATQLMSSPAVVLGGHPEPRFTPDLEVRHLRRMQQEGKLPPPTRITPADRVSVATQLQYALDPRPLPSPIAAPLVDGVVGATEERAGPGCVRLSPTGPVSEIHLAGGSPMSLRVTTEASGDLTGYLRLFTPVIHTGDPHVDKVRAGLPVFVNVTAAVDQVVLRVPPSGVTEVCGVL